MVITMKETGQYAEKIDGRMIRIVYEQGVKLDNGKRDVGVYYCRVIGGPRRFAGLMLTARHSCPPESPTALHWAALEAYRLVKTGVR